MNQKEILRIRNRRDSRGGSSVSSSSDRSVSSSRGGRSGHSSVNVSGWSHIRSWIRIPLLFMVLTVLSMGCKSVAQTIPENIQPRPGTETGYLLDDYRDRAIDILESSPLIDGHNDVPWQYRTRVNYKMSELDFMDTSHLDPPMHSDIPRLRAGRLGGQFWSVYVPANLPESEAVQATLEQIDFVYRMIDTWPDQFEPALTADEVQAAFDNGKIASMIGMEGGHSIGNSLATLRRFYDLGARYMTITHSRTLDWADSATDTPRHGGLTPFGEEVIREMNRLGMLVDLSHVSPETMRDAIRVSEAPVIFSHSSVRALSDHPRNVPDDVLDMVAAVNGVVMVTFVPSYVNEELRRYYGREEAQLAEMQYLYEGQLAKADSMMQRWYEQNPAPVATLDHVADHIDYIKNNYGIDYVGIGADFDGISTVPEGLSDVTTYPDLFTELLRRGYREEELRKIAGLNILRVMRQAEAVAAGLQSERGPSEAVIGDFD